MRVLVLLRHGESTWNAENRFTGWTDVDLSAGGLAEAQTAGAALKDKGYDFDIVFTSCLKRAIRTLWVVLEQLDRFYLQPFNEWRLNERHYGALQGLNKTEIATKYGEAQVHEWRRSYATPPPTLKRGDPQDAFTHPPYAHLPSEAVPLCESLKDTVQRVLPCWTDKIAPALKQEKKVLVAAHGNSLRALVMHLEKLSIEQVVKLNIPTGVPLVYELDDSLAVVRKFYLLDEKEVKERIEKVANQANAPADNCRGR